MDFAALIDAFGPWAIVVGALIWLAKFLSDQLEKAREDRNRESERHAQEVSELTTVIQNNTIAITQLTEYIKAERTDEE